MVQNDYQGGPTNGSPLNDPNDTSGQYAFNAEEYYRNMRNQLYGQGYTGPTNPYNIEFSNYMNPPTGYNPGGLRGNLMYMQPQQPFMGYGQQPTTNMSMQQGGMFTGNTPGYVGNPAFQIINNMRGAGQYPYPMYGYNPYMANFQLQFQDRVVHVPGYNPSGDSVLLESDTIDKLDQLQVDMMYDQQAAIAKREQRTQGYFNYNNPYGYYNYYGMPYYSQSYDQGVIYKYQQKVNELKQEAVDRRLEFNKNLSKMVHSYLDDGVTDEQIDKIYGGYTYTIPGATLERYSEQSRLSRMVPIDTASAYRAYDRQVSDLHDMIAPPGKGMNEFLNDCGFLKSMYNLDEEQHRRRDNKQYYDQDIYHACMRKFALKNNIDDSKVDYTPRSKMEIMNQILGKDQVADMERRGIHIDNNGTMNISASEEMKRRLDPQYYTGQNPPERVMTNELENDYNYKRNAFFNSIKRNDMIGFSPQGGSQS